MATAYTSIIQQMYVAFFNRPADFQGLRTWEAFSAGKTEAELKKAISAEFAKSDEYTIVFKGMNYNQIVTKVYQNLLNRDPDVPGLQNWVDHLVKGTSTVASLVTDIIRDAGAGDVDTIKNKTAAASKFTEALNTTDLINAYSGAAANAVAATWLKAVGETQASLDAAITTAALTKVTADVSANSGNAVGTTFTLTTGIDTLTGTALNDTFNAVPSKSQVAGELSTLDAYDTIDGGAGHDTLNIFVGMPSYLGGEDGSFANGTQQGTVKNVETINIHNTAGFPPFGYNSDAVDASKFVGATAINQIGYGYDIEKLGANTVAGFKNVEYLGVDVGAAAAVNSITVNLNNVGEDGGGYAGSIDAYGATLDTVNVTGNLVAAPVTGEDSYIDLEVTAGKNVTAVKVNSAVNIDLEVFTGEDSTKEVTVVNASGSTGNVRFTHYVGEDAASTEGDNFKTVLTGSGNDYVVLTTATLKDDTTTTADETISALVGTGAGDDEIYVYTSGTGTTKVEAGDGKDEVFVGRRGTGTLTVELGAGNDKFNSSVDITGKDVIDGGDGTDALFLNLVGSENIGAFSNFESFDAYQLAKTLDVEILASKNTVTEITTSGDVGSGATLTNLGAGVGFRAIGSMSDTITLTQKTAGAMIVALDADEVANDDGTTDEIGDSATLNATLTNATSVKAVFGADYLDALSSTVANNSTINLSAVKASAIEIVSGGAASLNAIAITTDDVSATDAKSALKTITITGDQHLTLTGVTLNGSTSDFVINAADLTGGLTASLGLVKNGGSITLGSGTDVITVDATSTTDLNAATTADGIESIVGFEKTAAVAVSTATADAAAAAAAIKVADKLVLTGANVANANADVTTGTIAKGILTFTGAGVTTLDGAIGIANSAADAVGEAVVFKYLNDSYVFVQGGSTTEGEVTTHAADIVVKLTGVTGITNFAEIGDTDSFFIV